MTANCGHCGWVADDATRLEATIRPVTHCPACQARRRFDLHPPGCRCGQHRKDTAL